MQLPNTRQMDSSIEVWYWNWLSSNCDPTAHLSQQYFLDIFSSVNKSPFFKIHVRI
jgi:hypothetical protein